MADLDTATFVRRAGTGAWTVFPMLGLFAAYSTFEVLQRQGMHCVQCASLSAR
jgi:hypothetical protein